MKHLALAILYTAAVALANPALADSAAASALREGAMKKLVFHPAPKPAGQTGFPDFDCAPPSLSDWQAQWALANF